MLKVFPGYNYVRIAIAVEELTHDHTVRYEC